jgi:regulator of cell morphogenesis and NO signaling
MMPTGCSYVARRKALALVRTAIARAEMGEAHALEVDVPPRPLLHQLWHDGVLARAVVLLERDGLHGRLVVLPRRAEGVPTIAELLESDHVRLDDLADRMCRTVQVEPLRAVVLAHLFAAGLKRHVRAEETILFPLFSAHLGGETHQVALMEREHIAIMHYVDRLLLAAGRVVDPLRRDEASEGLLRAHHGLAAVLSDHNDKEERTLFPLLDRTLPEEQRWEVLRRLLLF